DQLMSQWFDTQAGVPLQASGSFSEESGLSWRTTTKRSVDLLGSNRPIVTLEVFGRLHSSTQSLVELEVVAGGNAAP
ncbi:MAG: hypothetical protein AAF483_12150, partial [Planctomycetota bacterium]